MKYKNKDGKIIIQPKEDLFKEGIASPNCVDAAVLTMCVTDNAIQNNRRIQAKGSQFYDAMEGVWGSGRSDLSDKQIQTWP